MNDALKIKNLSKTYEGGFQALKDINLEVKRGEIFALLGPNGAGKTTMISIICGLVRKSQGEVLVGGLDFEKDYKKVRKEIGLVPQEISTNMFNTVEYMVAYTRGLFGLKKNPARIEQILKSLSLWDKRKNRIMTLSGGMKRRLMIAKALAHEPSILFLDEPTAGVDVELRKGMWTLVDELRNSGVTIILTTHYIEEAEEMADRVGVLRKGELILVEEKEKMMSRMGDKKLTIELEREIHKIPESLREFNLKHQENKLIYQYDGRSNKNALFTLLEQVKQEGLHCKDIKTEQSSLEEIFVNLVKDKK